MKTKEQIEELKEAVREEIKNGVIDDESERGHRLGSAMSAIEEFDTRLYPIPEKALERLRNKVMRVFDKCPIQKGE